ncbi:MAG TPA: phosphotransferase [Symbiobacteriaceae bacterium]|nr:phosphotransferase [Symbiobacteriaceae bacterium]
MDARVKALLTPADVALLAPRWGLAPDRLRFVGGFQNFVYEGELDGRPVIFRVSHQSHRTPELIRSELDFVQYLALHGLPVARPVAVPGSGALAEAAGEFTAAVFEKAPGGPDTDDVPGLLRRLGRLMGRMHALSRQYRPGPGVVPRWAWHENEYLNDLSRYVPTDQPLVHEAARRLVADLHGLPTPPEAYGLIHGDVVRGNIFFDQNDEITLFDFDEAQQGWYVNDVAIYLFYWIAFPKPGDEAFVAQFIDLFVGSYLEECPLDGIWLQQIPLFLKLRQLILYTAIHRSRDLNQLHPWEQSFLDFARPNLERGEPVIPFPFR